jgi:putative ABC transport system permease protein
MRSLVSHFRHTVRLLLKSPGFTITAILILGLGIGANTAIFSLIDGVLLKPLPNPQADRLVRIYQPTQDSDTMNVAYSDYIDFLASQRTLQDLALLYRDDLQIIGTGEPDRAEGAYVTGNFFTTLGRPFRLGRPFGEKEDASASYVVVLSERLWRTRFRSDPEVIGSSINLNGRIFKIVGVTPEQVNGSSEIDLYMPFSESIVSALRKTIAAIDPDLPLADVGSYDDLINKSFTPKRLSLIIVSLFSGVALLLAAIGLYAVLSYSVSLRIREIGVRMALGAGPANILKLVTGRGLKIVGAGLIVGLLAGFIVAHLIASILYGVSANGPVALGTSVLVLGFAALLACLLPAFRATRIDPMVALRE